MAVTCRTGIMIMMMLVVYCLFVPGVLLRPLRQHVVVLELRIFCEIK